MMIDIADMQICVDVSETKVINCPSTPQTNVNVRIFTWMDHLCSRIKPPKELALFASVVPCNHVTVLDCFKEGSFDWSQDLVALLPSMLQEKTVGKVLRDDYGVVGYDDLPSISESSEVVHRAVAGGCTGYARNIGLMKWHESLIIGNPKKSVGTDGKTLTESAEALQSIFLLAQKIL